MSITTESAPSTVAADLSSFVYASPSSFHAAANVRERLVSAGFSELDEADAWQLRAGGKYVVVRDGAAIAWVMPEGGAGDSTGNAGGAGKVSGASAPVFRVFGTHTDSPAFKLKPNPGFTTEGALQIGVEIYGGPLLNSWLDRELSLAGRLVTHGGQTVLARTKPIARIPQLAIHLDREVNQKLALDKQRHLQPVIGLEDLTGLAGSDGMQSTDVLEVLAASAGVKAADVAGFDVVTIAAQEPATFGLHDEFLASPRLDNLSSVHAGMSALALIDPSEISEIPLLAAFDHEEVGSNTRSGACGPFLADITERIVAAAAGDGDSGGNAAAGREVYLRSMASSICFSADTGHGVHPNFPERHDPVNRPRLGAGPLLKINAQQRYATDAIGTARFAAACDAADVAHQEFVSNNSMPCGSTIGPLTATRLGMTTVDIGIGLWSMHSAREMCAITDVHDMFHIAHAYMGGA
ncbi:M18 family aminopeptidase [Brevibacterium luteolum]|uniref:M18 family aminopeptidase n=1 Tax=Brevibacterium luteolum TaxID=199591 RepID=UPI001C24DDCF|nr:M18 family aminopeptidase [Brevibacterium luteolum]MBU8578888.1 M18 family aminopeptidase [Brevibacterium luteolum]